MTRRFFTASILGPLAAVASGAEIFSQPSDIADGYPSDGVSGQFWGVRIADDFAICSLGRVTQIRWWGSSENAFFNDLTNFERFHLVFFTSAAGLPDEVISAESFALAATDPQPTGNVNTIGGLEYQHTVTLATPIQLEVGVTYWLSIGSENVEPLDDGWLWASNVDDVQGVCAQETWGGSSWSLIAGDRAFVLFGDGTPCEVGCPNAGCEFGDFNDDCVISVDDLAVFLSNYGLSGVGPDGGDFDEDGSVGLSDLATILGAYGSNCN